MNVATRKCAVFGKVGSCPSVRRGFRLQSIIGIYADDDQTKSGVLRILGKCIFPLVLADIDQCHDFLYSANPELHRHDCKYR